MNIKLGSIIIVAIKNVRLHVMNTLADPIEMNGKLVDNSNMSLNEKCRGILSI